MKQYLFAVAIATLALSACKREAAPAPAPEAAPAVVAPDPTTATDATDVIDHSSPADAVKGFDTKAFAGKFDAPGTSLEIQADGAYHLNDANAATDGTWTVEADGKHILLDPASKGDADRRYEIVTQDELRSVDGSQSLSREQTK